MSPIRDCKCRVIRRHSRTAEHRPLESKVGEVGRILTEPGQSMVEAVVLEPPVGSICLLCRRSGRIEPGWEQRRQWAELAAGGIKGRIIRFLYHSVPFRPILRRRQQARGGWRTRGWSGREERPDIPISVPFRTHFVPLWGAGSRRRRVGGLGAGAANGHDMSRASVAGLDWVRRWTGPDLHL